MNLLIISAFAFINLFFLLCLFLLLKNKNKQLVKSQELARVRLDMWDADRFKLMIMDSEIKLLCDFVGYIGYAIHHLGQDIAYRRKDGIVNSEDEPLRKLFGESMALVGNEMRDFNTPRWNSLTKQEKEFVCSKIGKSINDFIDNKPIRLAIPGMKFDELKESYIFSFDLFIESLKNTAKLFFDELNSGTPHRKIDIFKYDHYLFGKYGYVFAKDGNIANTTNSLRIISRSFHNANSINENGEVIIIIYHYNAILPYIEYLEANGQFNDSKDWEFYQGIIKNLEKENKLELIY